jgi:hypothetical protein
MPVNSIWENVNGLVVVADVLNEDFRTTVSFAPSRFMIFPPVLIPSTVTRPEVADERTVSFQQIVKFYMKLMHIIVHKIAVTNGCLTWPASEGIQQVACFPSLEYSIAYCCNSTSSTEIQAEKLFNCNMSLQSVS